MQILSFKHYILVFNDIIQQIYIFIRFLWNIYILLFLDIIYLFLFTICQFDEFINQLLRNKMK